MIREAALVCFNSDTEFSSNTFEVRNKSDVTKARCIHSAALEKVTELGELSVDKNRRKKRTEQSHYENLEPGRVSRVV